MAAKTRLDDILGFLYNAGKLDCGEVATLIAAMDCLSYEIENHGPQSSRLIEDYGTQIQDGITSLQGVKS